MHSSKSKSRFELVRPATFLVGICFLGAVLRLHHIGDRSFWLDEAFSWTMASQHSVHEIFLRSTNDFNPPLYYIFLKYWISLFGDSEFSQRGLSVAFAIATIVSVYFLCRDAFPEENRPSNKHKTASQHEIGLVAAAFTAVSASHIQWSVETRMYTQGTFLAVLSTWALLHCVKTNASSLTWKLLYTLSATALLYTHTFGIFTVFGQACFVCVLLLNQRYFKTESQPLTETVENSQVAIDDTSCFTTIRQFCYMYFVVGIACAPWAYVLLGQAQRAKSEYWIPAMDAWTLPTTWAQLIAPSNHLPQFMNHTFSMIISIGTLTILIVYFVIARSAGARLVVTMLLLPIVCASIVSLRFVPIIMPKHLLIAFLFFICIGSYVICLVPSQSLRRGIVLILLGDCLYLHYCYQEELDVSSRPGIRKITEIVHDNFRDGDSVVVKNPAMLFSSRYYFRENTIKPMLLKNTKIASYSGLALIDSTDQILNKELRDADVLRVWEIDSTGFAQSPAGSYEKLREKHWRKESTVAHQGVLHFERKVVLNLYERVP